MPANPDFIAMAARAEAGGDATLSDDCWRACGWTERMEWNGGSWKSPDRKIHPGRRPDLLTSIDPQAALPGRIIKTDCFTSVEGPPFRWEHRATAWIEGTGHMGNCFNAPTEPLARLAAKLRAMAAKDRTDAR